MMLAKSMTILRALMDAETGGTGSTRLSTGSTFPALAKPQSQRTLALSHRLSAFISAMTIRRPSRSAAPTNVCRAALV